MDLGTQDVSIGLELSPTLFREHIYIASSLSAEAITSILKRYLGTCGIDRDDLVYITRRSIDLEQSFGQLTELDPQRPHVPQTCISILELQLQRDTPESIRQRIDRLTQLLPLVRSYGAVVYYPSAQAQHPIAHVVSDLDGTLLQDELLVSLAKQVGLGQAFEEITQQAMLGTINFEDSFRLRTRMLSGTKLDLLVATARSARLALGIEPFYRWLTDCGLSLDIVTSNYDIFCQALQDRLTYDHYYASSPSFSGGELTGQFSGQVVDAEAKARLVQTIARERYVSLDQMLVVGDGANDLPMLAHAGHAMLYCASAIGAAPALPLTTMIDLLRLS